MNLFNESENKYFELLSYLVNGKGSYTDKEINDYLNDFLRDSRDYDVEDMLFNHNPDNATVFSYEDGQYVPVLADPLPIRNNKMDSQAVKALLNNPFSRLFLSDSTLAKLEENSSGIPLHWDLRDIRVKNQNCSDMIYECNAETLRLIISAIEGHKGIICNNTVPGKFEHVDQLVFPVRVEYSFINNVIRICAYSEAEDRFIKMNLTNISDVRLVQEVKENLEAEYKEYIEINTKKVVLDVDPISHVIERCFRIFSYYDRLARYDKENDKYTLEIKYLKADEAEVIRDILSLGGYVVVTEPRRIQKEVYKRIMLARQLYE